MVSSQLAEIASKYLKKDGKVYIESSLRKRKYKDKSGSEKEITEIRADEL
ncbi:single-stranded DNA-binding protein [Acinetobacter soli]|nr:single-stranded DNA-binding protein [Acinetobacter soli]